MANSLSLGNGFLLINLDHHGLVRDCYFPYVGLENHLGGHMAHLVGVFVDGTLSWLTEESWQITVQSDDDSLAGKILAINDSLGVSLLFTDLVYNEENVFVRRVIVKNLRDNFARTVKVFFHQQFELYESHSAHTGFYDPLRKVIIHYRNQRAFLINASLEGKNFDDYSIGIFAAEGKEGTHRDAEDGQLAKNNIEHGQVDSVVALTANLNPLEEKIVYYWLVAGKSINQVLELNSLVLAKGPGHLIETTRNFWQAWVRRRNFDFYKLSPEVVNLFHRSLLIIRAHVSNNGAIIASSDSNSLQKGKDTYNYVWPRDASFSALALTEAGDLNVAQSFFSFANHVVTKDGYFMHKYSPDRSLGSSWHPWINSAGEFQLPIQEDGTALVLQTLWRYYEVSKDLEFIETIYNSLIKRAADFMVLYRDEQTGLPRPSYDLWEERYGVHTFTAAAVYGGLTTAANFARLLGKFKSENIYLDAATQLQQGIVDQLYDAEEKIFYKTIHPSKDQIICDNLIDASSVYGIFAFGVLPITDDRLATAMAITEKELSGKNSIGGLARYQNDSYHRQDSYYPGNPWFICTLWLAQYYIARAEREQDLEQAREKLLWCAKYVSPSGLLSEQLNPYTGEPLSVTPLVWSHAEFVRTVIAYLNKLESLGICQSCNPVS